MKENWRNRKFGAGGQFEQGNWIQSSFKRKKQTGLSLRSGGRVQLNLIRQDSPSSTTVVCEEKEETPRCISSTGVHDCALKHRFSLLLIKAI